MGLFSFLKTAGAKIMGWHTEPAKAESGADAAAMKKNREDLMVQMVNKMNLPVSNVSVDIDGDQLTLYGTAETQEAKEKVVLAVGNVEGIATVDDRMSVDAPEPAAQFYTVVKGDSLSKIAQHYYGDPMKYPMIFEANRPMLEDPDLIYPGQVLRIPAMA